jgi:hypothetical protein
MWSPSPWSSLSKDVTLILQSDGISAIGVLNLKISMKRISLMPLFALCLSAIVDCLTAAEASRTVPPGTDLQAVLDRGGSLLLQPRQVYEIRKPLRFKATGQRIATEGATHLSEHAVLRIVDPECAQLVNGNQQHEVLLERVTLDGNRYVLSDVGKSPLRGDALVHFGGPQAANQVIRHCVLMSPRAWSALKLHEGATGLRAESNIILGVGSDIRGNGREGRERSTSWGDGIGCAARGSVVRDNLIIDPTDGAIVVFAAPGSVIEGNVIASISRESLGGINLVDPMPFYAMDGDPGRTDYRGTIVRNNLFDAFGARIHIAVPMGAPIWAPKNLGKVLVGATVTGNEIRGGAAAYGFVANGVEGFTVSGNTSAAIYSGLAEGEPPKFPPAAPGPFLYNPDAVVASSLQPEFKTPEGQLMHLLRCNHLKPNPLGYRTGYAYGTAEAEAVVQAAYFEMLGRMPIARELSHAIRWLNEADGTADDLRRNLMMSEEFTSAYGFVPPERLHPYRVELWLKHLDQARREHMAAHGSPPTAKTLYEDALTMLHRTARK